MIIIFVNNVDVINNDDTNVSDNFNTNNNGDINFYIFLDEEY